MVRSVSIYDMTLEGVSVVLSLRAFVFERVSPGSASEVDFYIICISCDSLFMQYKILALFSFHSPRYRID